MKFKTVIISAFPGMGKSYVYKKYGEEFCSDSDSSQFDKSQFPSNYITHIKSLLGEKKFIFVSSHKVVRDSLRLEDMPYVLVYPTVNRKQEFLENYKNRGNTEGFIKLLEENFEKWVQECEVAEYPNHIQCPQGFIEDILCYLDTELEENK